MLDPEELKDTNDVLTEKERLAALFDYNEEELLTALSQQDINDFEIGDFNTDDISDGYHTFGELYHHRAVLFAVIVNANPGLSFKSKLHDNGTMFDGMFIVGIKTPEGWYSYHYDLDEWDMFKCKEWKRAPKWDGHQPDDVERLLSLQHPRNPVGAMASALNTVPNTASMSISVNDAIDAHNYAINGMQALSEQIHNKIHNNHMRNTH